MRLMTISVLAGMLAFGTAQAADVPADWVEVAAGAMFTIHAPPGTTFERVRAVLAPDMTDRVRDVMADKYWTQGDFIVRRMNHPYLLRLEPEPAS